MRKSTIAMLMLGLFFLSVGCSKEKREKLAEIIEGNYIGTYTYRDADGNDISIEDYVISVTEEDRQKILAKTISGNEFVSRSVDLKRDFSDDIVSSNENELAQFRFEEGLVTYTLKITTDSTNPANYFRFTGGN